MQYIELGGSRSQGATVSGDPGTIDAPNYLEREIDWPNLALDEVVTLIAGMAMVDGGSGLLQLDTVVAGVVTGTAVASVVPITDATFVEQELTVPREVAKTKYRLRATVTSGDGASPLLFGVIRISLAEDDTESPCGALRTAAANIALGHLGITDQLLDLEVDDRVEAVQARLHFDKALDEVLRAFDWPFATGYESLAWVAGSADTPVNPDWVYWYRLPDDCLKIRRVIKRGVGRRFDGDPVTFRQGANDEDGRTLFCDYADPDSDDLDEPDLPVEVTKRPACALESGDAQFAEAFCWKLAGKLAPAVTRNKITAADCFGMFDRVIAQAKVTAANEKQDGLEPERLPRWMRDR